MAWCFAALIGAVFVWVWVASSPRYALPCAPSERFAYYERWFVEGPGRGETLHERINGSCSLVWQKFGVNNLSCAGLFFGGLKLLSRLVILFFPLGLRWKMGENLPWNIVFWTFGILFACWLYTVVYGAIGERELFLGKIRNNEKQLAAKLGRVMLDAHLKVGTSDAAKRKAAIRDVLECMHFRARIATQDFEDNYLEATLLCFADQDCSKIAVKERATALRAIGTVVDSNGTLAYYAAKRGKPRAINHLARFSPFENKGLSDPDESPPYASILVLPILKVSGTGKVCLGVVAIDSSRPFHFWLRYDEIIARMAPYLSLLRLLLDSPEINAIAISQHEKK